MKCSVKSCDVTYGHMRFLQLKYCDPCHVSGTSIQGGARSARVRELHYRDWGHILWQPEARLQVGGHVTRDPRVPSIWLPLHCSEPYPYYAAPQEHRRPMDNFRDFADIKQERLYNIYRSKLRNRRGWVRTLKFRKYCVLNKSSKYFQIKTVENIYDICDDSQDFTFI